MLPRRWAAMSMGMAKSKLTTTGTIEASRPKSPPVTRVGPVGVVISRPDDA